MAITTLGGITVKTLCITACLWAAATAADCPGGGGGGGGPFSPLLRASDFAAERRSALRGHTVGGTGRGGTSRAARCAKLCADTAGCRSFNHDRAGGVCQLNDARKSQFPADFYADQTFDYYEEVGDICQQSTLAPDIDLGSDQPPVEGTQGPDGSDDDDTDSDIDSDIDTDTNIDTDSDTDIDTDSDTDSGNDSETDNGDDTVTGSVTDVTDVNDGDTD